MIFQILLSREEVDNPRAMRVCHRVYGKIATRKIFRERTREGDTLGVSLIEVFAIDAIGCDFVGRGGFQKGDGAVLYTRFNDTLCVENSLCLFGCGVGGDIKIVRRDTEQIIADRSADNMGMEAVFFIGIDDVPDIVWNGKEHARPSFLFPLLYHRFCYLSKVFYFFSLSVYIFLFGGKE